MDNLNKTNSSWIKRLIMLMGLVIACSFVWLLFYSFPYPYVECDFDSVYIINSLSILTDHTVRPNSNPGVTLQWLGTISIIIGSFFTQGRDLIAKVIANPGVFQQINLAILAACFTCSILFCLNNLYKKNDRLLSIALAVCGVAFMFPPSLSAASGVNADFMAFIIAISFVASLLKERTLRSDAITALLFVLMIYAKIVFLPLGILFLTFNKKTFFRLTTATAIWSIVIFLLFWDIERLGSFVHFMRNYSIINKTDGVDISEIIDFYAGFFRENLIQSLYILTAMSFSVLLIVKKKCRMTGLITFVLITFLVAMTFVRQYKAPVYTWIIFPIGIFLLPKVLRQYRKLIVPATIFIVILFILTVGKLYGDSSELRIERKTILNFQSEYMEVLKETSPACLVEYLKRPNWHSIGQSFWKANSYAQCEYAEYIKDYTKEAWGIDSYYSFVRKKPSDVRVIRSYFGNEEINILEVIPDRGTLLAIGTDFVTKFRNTFPQLSLELYKKSEIYDVSFFKVTKKTIQENIF